MWSRVRAPREVGLFAPLARKSPPGPFQTAAAAQCPDFCFWGKMRAYPEGAAGRRGRARAQCNGASSSRVLNNYRPNSKFEKSAWWHHLDRHSRKNGNRSRQPWSNGQDSGLPSQRPGFDSRRLHHAILVVGGNIRHSIVVRTPGPHPGDLGSIPSGGICGRPRLGTHRDLGGFRHSAASEYSDEVAERSLPSPGRAMTCEQTGVEV